MYYGKKPDAGTLKPSTVPATQKAKATLPSMPDAMAQADYPSRTPAVQAQAKAPAKRNMPSQANKSGALRGADRAAVAKTLGKKKGK